MTRCDMGVTLRGSVCSSDKGNIISNYVFSFKLSDKKVASFDARTVISTMRFSTKDSLTLVSSSEDNLDGFLTFWGIIGGGMIKLEIENGTTIEGPIEGGPVEPQSIVGVGAWSRA
jgi:hypothetical protein